MKNKNEKQKLNTSNKKSGVKNQPAASTEIEISTGKSKSNSIAGLNKSENEIYFHDLADLMPAKISNATAEGELIYLNKNWLDFTGMDFKELKNFGYYNIIHPEDLNLFKELFHAAEVTKTILEMEMRFLNKDKKYIWHLNRASPILDHLGNIKIWVGVTTDITEQKNQQLKEKELLNRFQNLVLQAPVAMCVLRGKNYVIELINESMADMWGRKQEDIINRPAFDVLTGLGDKGFKELLDHVLMTGERCVAEELPVSLKRNEKLNNAFVKFIYEPLREADGSITGVMALAHEITEQVQARKKIEESESFNRTILENSPDCIKILDTDGRLNYMNKNGQCLMEIDDFELYENKYWWDLWNDENKPLVKKAIAKAKKGEKTQMQLLGNTTKGNPRWWDIIVSPMQVLDNKKKQPQIISISRDITEQKNQQLKEKELLNRFQNLVLQAPVAICVLRGENYVIELINERMADMWDRKREEILNRPAFDVLAELRNQGFKELLDHVYTTGERFVAEELPISLKRNGTLENAFVKFIYEPLREADGSITGVMALAHEITEQVLGRKKMEVQALLHENMLMTSPGFVCTMVGPTYVYDLINERYQKIFGNRKLKGKAMLDAIPELKGQGIDTLLHKVYTTGETYVGNDMPISISRNENTAPVLCYFNFSYQPMYNEQNEIFSILVFGYEVTEQVVARNLIFEIEQNHSKELEESVGLRTMELTNANKQLLQRNKEIEKQGARLVILNKELNFQNIEKEKRAAELLTANRELIFQNQEKQKREAELFIANKELIFQNDEKAKTATKLNIANTELQAFNHISSHDLQEPLRKIQTFASRILDDEYENLTEKGKNSFQRIQNAAERMRILIDDLIAFSKLQPDERKFEKTDLTKIVTEVILDLKEVIDENKATVVTKTLCDVNIIPFQFYQLFYNLLSNALKFAKPDVASHIVISSTVEKGRKLKNEQLIPNQNYCHISITDNGIGFDPEFSERIFGVFQKLHGKDEYEGSGIGLAIVKKIVDNHKGIVLASSELNKGAKFDIYIPAD